MVANVERWTKKVPLEKLVSDALVKNFGPKFPGKMVPWKEFAGVGEISVSTGNVFLDVASAPPEIQEFLTEFTRARMAGGEILEKFLESHGKDPVDFFAQPVGPNKEDLRYLTVSQTTRVLTSLLTSGWQFSFNGNNQ